MSDSYFFMALLTSTGVYMYIFFKIRKLKGEISDRNWGVIYINFKINFNPKKLAEIFMLTWGNIKD